jgi:tetratricopeptide (TPR) repeat protein
MGVYWMNKCAQAVKNLDHEAAKVSVSNAYYASQFHPEII